MADPAGDDRLQMPEPPPDPRAAGRWYKRRGVAMGMVGVLAFTGGLLVGNADQPQLQEELAAAEDMAANLRAQIEKAESNADEAVQRAAEVEQELADLADLETALAEEREALDERAEELDVVEEGEEALAEAQESDVGVGSTVDFNDWTLTLAEVQTHGSIGGSTPRGKYVALIFEVTNNASVERELMEGFDKDFRLVDVATEREYSFDSEASLDHHHTFRVDTWHLEDIGPGFTARVPIVFDVAEEMRGGMAAMVAGRNVSDLFFVDLQQ